MNHPIIRPALETDLPRLLEIYNEEVEHGTATFDTKPLSLEERLVWFKAHNKDNHPLIVLEQDHTVWGYGQLLTEAILQMAVADSATHRVYSLITAENQASIALHRKLGFRLVGTITQAGVKFGRWLDVTYWEKAV